MTTDTPTPDDATLAEIRARFPAVECESCQDCGQPYEPWTVNNRLWNWVMGDGNGILCPRCFTIRAKGHARVWSVEAEADKTALELRRALFHERENYDRWQTAEAALAAERERVARVEAVERHMANCALAAWRSAQARHGCSDEQALTQHADSRGRRVMVQTLDSGHRKARKSYRCGLCDIAIKPGDLHAFQTNIYDGRIYTWRDCLWCDRDRVVTYLHDWTDGDGVNYEAASEWAPDAALYAPKVPERVAARNWLARAANPDTTTERTGR